VISGCAFWAVVGRKPFDNLERSSRLIASEVGGQPPSHVSEKLVNLDPSKGLVGHIGSATHRIPV
jgi:hypothetical protein